MNVTDHTPDAAAPDAAVQHGAQGSVGEWAAPENSHTWMSVPEVAQKLGARDRDVRSMLRDRRLLATRRREGKGPQIPADMLVLVEGVWQVLPSLHGTLVLLADCGLDDEEAMRWLLAQDDQLDAVPLEALRAERTHAVRRVASTLAL